MDCRQKERIKKAGLAPAFILHNGAYLKPPLLLSLQKRVDFREALCYNILKEKGGVIMIKTEELDKAIKNSGYRYNYIAAQLGISYYGFRKKIDNKSEFKVREVQELQKLLGLTNAQRDYIFFS